MQYMMISHKNLDVPHGQINSAGKECMMMPTEDIQRAIGLVFITMKARQFEKRFAHLVERWRMNCEVVLDHRALDIFAKKDFRNIAKCIARCGVRCTIHAPFQELFLGAPDILVRKAAIERLKYAFDIASLFKPESIVLHLNYEEKRFGFVYAEWFKNIIPNLAVFAKKAEAMGAVLSLENVYEESPDTMREVVSRLSAKNVGCCLDVGHVNAFSNATLRQWFARTGEFIRQFHLHDNDGKKDAHAPIGDGNIDFSHVARYISSAKHSVLVTLEPHTEENIWKTLEGFCAKGLLRAMEAQRN